MPLLILLGLGVAAAVVYFATHNPTIDFAPDGSGGAAALPFDTETTGDFGFAWEPSPNKSSRNGAKATMLIWHYTAGVSAKSAIAWLCKPEARASAHFVIDRDGTITQLVSCADAAWHAGSSQYNATTIGVEIVNPGYVEPDGSGGWTYANGSERRAWKPDATPVQKSLRFPNGLTVTHWWVPYTPAQLAAIKTLQAKLAASAWRACLRDQRGHESIREPVGAKTDPGPLFPWDKVCAFDDRKLNTTKVV